MSACARCTAPADGTYRICGNCGDDIARDLAFIPALLGELQTTYSRQDRLTTARGRSGDDGLPWKEPALTAAIELGDCLRRWATALPIPNHDQIPTDPADLASWLHSRVDWIRAGEHAENAHREITDTVGRAITVIDLPANRARFEIGPCPEILVDSNQCDGTVWAYIATRPEDMSLLRCRTCNSRWNTTQWLRVGKRILTRIRQLRGVRAA